MRIDKAKSRTAALLIAPAVAILLIVNIVPLILGVWLSLQNYTLGRGTPRFAGLSNYTWLLEDDRFISSLYTSAYLVTISVSMQLVLGLSLALLFNKKLRGFETIRQLSIMPIMVAPPVVGLIWLYLYYDKFGLIVYFASLIGFDGQQFLTDRTLAIWSVAIADTWQWTPFVLLVLFAALQSVPEYVYEAAKIDGLTGWQTFWKVTLPLLRPAIMVVILIRAVDTFRSFDLVFMMTQGGPAGRTETLPWYIYVTGFKGLDLGAAAAMSVVMIIIVNIFAVVFVRRFAWRT